MDIFGSAHRSPWDSVLTPDTTAVDVAVAKLKSAHNVPTQLGETVATVLAHFTASSNFQSFDATA